MKLMIKHLHFVLAAAFYLGLVFMPGTAKAETAGHCVYVGNDNNRGYLGNRCSKKIYVFWCVPSSSDPRITCKTGPGEHYFNQWTYLEGGEKHSRGSATPLNARIEWGACDWMDKADSDNHGRYTCKSRH